MPFFIVLFVALRLARRREHRWLGSALEGEVGRGGAVRRSSRCYAIPGGARQRGVRSALPPDRTRSGSSESSTDGRWTCRCSRRAPSVRMIPIWCAPGRGSRACANACGRHRASRPHSASARDRRGAPGTPPRDAVDA
jgi:hypothetical protein